jgi:hypothetical protein
MGLAEQLKAGATLTRTSTIFNTSAAGSGSVQIGSAYSLLSVQTDTPCRLRLYEDVTSRDNAGEIARPFGNQFVSASVALIGDFSMSAAGTYTVDPILHSVSPVIASPLTYYRTDPATVATVGLKTFLLEDNTISPTPNTAYTLSNRRTFTITADLAATELVSGTLAVSTVPTTYLLVSGALVDNSQIGRLRLYSTTASFGDGTERNRPFSTEPSASMDLIADIIMSGSNVTHFVPKIVGANLANRGQNLQVIRSISSLLDGKNELYYIFGNVGTGATVTMNANVHVYALED